MARCVARCGENDNAPVAEHVMVALKLGHRVLGLEPPHPEWCRPLILSLLDQQHRRWEQTNIADMIGVGVRDGNELDVGGLYTKLLKLADKRLRPTPVGHSRIGRRLALWHCRDCIGHASIPKKPALRVTDEIAIVDEVHGFADVDAWRPARDIASYALPAVQYVELLDHALCCDC